MTWEELIYTLKTTKPNKSPGPDGFTVEFFKFFINDIGHLLLRSFNEGFEKGTMSVSFRQGSITMIPKENKSRRYIKNLRPISLLSVGYNLASGCIANRLKNVLPNIIHESQYGFLAGRQMSSAIRNIYETLIFAEKNQIPGMILSIDMEKAFDSISWSFMFKALEFFNFGPDFIKWIKTLYNDISSCVAVNGQYTQWFPIERGVRQGDPSSPYLYLVCAEILSLMLRNNPSIKGISINNKDNLLAQFADDTTLCLDGSERSFCEAIRTITRFARMSGLKMNKQKTQCVFIGSFKNSDIRYMRDENFVWNPGTFKILGILFSTDTQTIVDINYENKLNEIKRTLNKWKKRKLTPFGKVIIIKTLAISKVTHLFINLPDPKKEFMDNLEKEIYQFLWDDKPSKIKKTVICKEYKEGGIRMCNIQNFLCTMKLSVFRNLKRNEVLKNFTLNIYPKLDEILKFGTDFCKSVRKDIDNQFWKDVLKHVLSLYDKCKPKDAKELYGDHLFYNQYITRDHKSIYEKAWADNGIIYIYQITNGNGSFMNYQEFMVKYPNINSNFLNYYGIVRAIKRYIQSSNINIPPNINANNCSKIELVLNKSNKLISSILNDSNSVPSAVIKWNTKFDNLQWETIFQKIYITSSDVQLRWFQYRIVHRLLPTQRFLYLRKLVDDPVCTFCNQEEQTLDHLFFECNYVSKLWNDLTEDLKSKCAHCDNLRLSKEFILFGTTGTFFSDKAFDKIILLVKFYIYICKLENSLPTYDRFVAYLKKRVNIEKYMAKTQNATERFNDMWSQYIVILH